MSDEFDSSEFSEEIDQIKNKTLEEDNDTTGL